MLYLPYGFSSSIHRSGHAACWCPPLGGIVQFGGWPRSEELGRTIHQDGSSCPLYVLSAKEIAMGVARARRVEAGGAAAVATARGAMVVEEEERRQRHADAVAAAGGRSVFQLEASNANYTASATMGNAALDFNGLSGAVTSGGGRPRRRVWMLSTTGSGHTRTEPAGGGAAASACYAWVEAGAAVAREDARARLGLQEVGARLEPNQRSTSLGRTATVILAEHEAADAGTSDSYTPSRHYADGYQSEPSEFADPQSGGEHARLETAQHSESSSRSNASSPSPEAGVQATQTVVSGTAVAPVVTAELLRALGGSNGGEALREVTAGTDTATCTEPAQTTAAETVHSTSVGSTGFLPAMLLASQRTHGAGDRFREAPPITRDVAHIPGKHTTRPLRWRARREIISPRTRHGHHLVYHDGALYVIGGSYWAHGNGLAACDMCYRIRQHQWRQLDSLFPPRFCAALAESNATVMDKRRCVKESEDGGVCRRNSDRPSPDEVDGRPSKVLYSFGGLDVTERPTATLHRVWLPCGAQQELPQYGATPRPQFKSLLVCDVTQEWSVAAARDGSRALGRLFLLDGFQEGRSMAPSLRYYSLASCFWVRVCTSPDLVRGQVAGVWRSSVPPPDADSGARLRYLQRDERSSGDDSNTLRQSTSMSTEATVTAVAGEGGVLSTRRGAAIVNSDDEGRLHKDSHSHSHSSDGPTFLHRFDVFGGMPSRRGRQRRSRVCYSFDAGRQSFDYVNPLPVPGLTAHVIVPLPTASDASDADEETSYWLRMLRDTYGVSAVSCGGNEDLNDHEQNSLGEPVSWVYLLGSREIPLAEQTRVYIDTRKIPVRIMLAPKRDELLDELF